MDDNLEKELFALQERRSARVMMIVVAIFAGVFLFVFYFLLQNG